VSGLLTGGLPAAALIMGTAAAVSLALTVLLRALLLRAGSVDYPRADRWHRRPVARPGGPALFAAWMTVLVLLVPGEARARLLPVAAAAGAVFALGLIDDLLRLQTLPKLLLLIVAACLPPALGLRFEMFPPAVGVPLTIFWVLGITNAFNWLDNIDGLAAGIAAIAGGFLLVQVLLAGDPVLAAGAALTAGVALGFLTFNIHPARVFMGDSGSGFLGCLLAVLPVAGSVQTVGNVVTTLVVPILLLSVPIFDTALVTLMRLRGGRPLLRGGTDHPSHRLVALGLSERRAVFNLYALSALAGGVGLAASRLDLLSALVLTAVALTLFTALGFVLSRVRVTPREEPSTGVGVILVQVMHKRRILEMLVDVTLILAAYLGANLLRFEGGLPASIMAALPLVLPALVAIKMSVLYVMGVYRGEWRYAGFLDIALLLRAVTLASLVSVTALVLTTRLVNVSRTALILDWLLTVVFLSGARFSIRLLQEMLAAQRTAGRPVLLYGAGEGGLLLLAELRNNPIHGLHPVGFLDDDPGKQGIQLRGVPVLGTRRDIPELVRRMQIAEVLVAAPSMARSDLEAVQTICAEAGVTCRAMSPLLS
jgi:UDP-GlcNAc:undecaprenyl-phosphate GlcNAc-1-phosphate transferase